MDVDVAIIGGGPAGSTTAAILRKYAPHLSVLILERERFPRDHVGESQLPLVCAYLDEMGCWDKVEAAGFPIKVGATYRWGSSPDLWRFNFLPHGELTPEPRPGRFCGQRAHTAFQVDRSTYDQILLDHAAELGAEVRQQTGVREVLREEDRVTGLQTTTRTEPITAKYYVDCSGGGGILRRAMGVQVDSPTSLRNIAIWDYWQDARWAVELGNGGTRIQVLSLGYGWIWFIPISSTRTSVGLVVPAEYYKLSGLKPSEIYAKALRDEPRISQLLTQATSEGKLQTTNDWSFLAQRLTGQNWFLAGDACGFADPILSAGMTLAQGSGREVAYTIAEIERGEHETAWLKASYEDVHLRRIRQHIRFADYWYSANGQFSDLKEFSAKIAADAGLNLDADSAFQWLGTGGFANDDLAQASLGAYSLQAVKQITGLLSGTPAGWSVNRFNEFQLNLGGVRTESRAHYDEGRVTPLKTLVRGRKQLPLMGPFLVVYLVLKSHRKLPDILRAIRERIPASGAEAEAAYGSCIHALEAMVAEGWVVGSRNKKISANLNLSSELTAATIEYDQ